MLLIRLKTFLKSLFWHIYSGSPKSTQLEINYRYDICLKCDSFNRQKKQCDVCGCAINNRKIFMNKLAWADQECPLNKWEKITR